MLKNYLKEILLGVIVILQLGLYAFWFYDFYFAKKNVDNDSKIISSLEVTETDNLSLEENSKVIETKIYAEVKGAVNNPGVYEVNSNAIINDLVLLAGGFKDSAYTKNINLSRKVTDEMVINVYTNYEYNKLNEEVKPEIIYVEKECNCPTYDITSCINDGASVIESTKENTTVENPSDNFIEDNTLININTASKEKLMELSGIGEAKATQIIEYRKTNGNFENVEDIKNVSGISDSIFEKIKDNITV